MRGLLLLTLLIAGGCWLLMNADLERPPHTTPAPAPAKTAVEPDDGKLWPDLGITLDMAGIHEKMGVQPLPEGGVYINSVLPGSPAARAGLRVGDMIQVIQGGSLLRTPIELMTWIQGLEIGKPIRITVRRPTISAYDYPIWQRLKVEITPETRATVETNALRYGFVRLSDGFRALPDLEPYTGEALDGRLEVGATGHVKRAKVIQIIGPSDVIVEIKGTWARFARVNTESMLDDELIAFSNPFVVIGTWRYQTVLGSARSIYLAAPLKIAQNGLSTGELDALKAELGR